MNMKKILGVAAVAAVIPSVNAACPTGGFYAGLNLGASFNNYTVDFKGAKQFGWIDALSKMLLKNINEAKATVDAKETELAQKVFGAFVNGEEGVVTREKVNDLLAGMTSTLELIKGIKLEGAEQENEDDLSDWFKNGNNQAAFIDAFKKDIMQDMLDGQSNVTKAVIEGLKDADVKFDFDGFDASFNKLKEQQDLLNGYLKTYDLKANDPELSAKFASAVYKQEMGEVLSDSDGKKSKKPSGLTVSGTAGYDWLVGDFRFGLALEFGIDTAKAKIADSGKKSAIEFKRTWYGSAMGSVGMMFTTQFEGHILVGASLNRYRIDMTNFGVVLDRATKIIDDAASAINVDSTETKKEIEAMKFGKKNKTKAAFVVGAGCMYFFTPNVAMTLDFTFQPKTKFATVDRNGIEAKHSVMQIKGGVRYYF